MSVYIKGMEMPKDCPYCPLAHWNFKNEFMGCEIAKKHFSTEELYADGRPEFCPLVSVPPHGRLIDGDKLAEEQKENVGAYHANLITLDDLAECLLMQSISEDGAPTVIPADKEDE